MWVGTHIAVLKGTRVGDDVISAECQEPQAFLLTTPKIGMMVVVIVLLLVLVWPGKNSLQAVAFANKPQPMVII